MLPADVPEYRVHTKLSRVEYWGHLLEIVAFIAAAISMGALLVSAYGMRYANDGTRESRVFRPGRGITIINRGVRSAAPVLLYSHLVQWEPLGVARQTLRLPIAQELTFERSFVIERHTYETLRITYGYCYQRLDNRSVTALVPTRARDGAFDVRDLLRANGAHAGLRCGGTLSYNGEYAL